MLVHKIEQGTQEWFSVRAGIPTASNFDKLITSTGEPSKSLPGYALTLACGKYAGKPVDVFAGNAFTERGLLLETDAKAAYGFLSYEVIPVGFVTDDNKRYGCSPDGLVNDDGLIEIKCLKAENHLKAILYHKKHGKCPPDYVQQTQGQLLICERAWCDLFFYHPDLPPLIIRQQPIKTIQEALLAQIAVVIIERDRILEDIK